MVLVKNIGNFLCKSLSPSGGGVRELMGGKEEDRPPGGGSNGYKELL